MEHVLSEEERRERRERESISYRKEKREAGGEWRVDRKRPYAFCLKKNVSCIRDKEKTEREKKEDSFI